MTCASAWFPATGRLETFGVFPERPSLMERGVKDGVGSLYVEMAQRGELLQAGEYAPDLDAMFAEVLRRWGTPRTVVADRWKEAELRNALSRVNFPMARLVLRGMGFLDGSSDVRAFRKMCLTDRVFPEKSLLLRSAMSECRVVGDLAAKSENCKRLLKGGQEGSEASDDAAVSAVLAVAEGSRWVKPKPMPEIRIVRAA